MKMKAEVLKGITEKSVKEMIAILNHEPFFQGNPIRGKRHANKSDLAQIMVDRVLGAADRGVKIPEDIDILVGKLVDASDILATVGIPTKPVADPQEQMFLFLDDLRDSGETNMFGAAPYLTDEFGLDKKSAREVLKRWMETFSKRHPAPEPDMPTSCECDNTHEQNKTVCRFCWAKGIRYQPPVEKKPTLVDRVLEEVAKPPTKKPKATKAPAVIMNGVRKPKESGACGQAWAIFDSILKMKGEVNIAEALEWAAEGNLNPGNVKTEFYYWKKFYGLSKPKKGGAENVG